MLPQVSMPKFPHREPRHCPVKEAEEAVTAAYGVVRTDPEAAKIKEQVSEGELVFWMTIKDSTKAEEYEAYLETFPEGLFAPLALRRSMRNGGTAVASEPPPVPVARTSGLDFDRLNERAKENTEKAK